MTNGEHTKDIPTLATTLQELADFAIVAEFYSTDMSDHKLTNIKVGPNRMSTVCRIRRFWVIPNDGGFSNSAKIPRDKLRNIEIQSPEEVAKIFEEAGMVKVEVG